MECRRLAYFQANLVPSLLANEVPIVMLGLRYWRRRQSVAGHGKSRTFIHCTVTIGAIEESCGSHIEAARNGSDRIRLCHLRRAEAESMNVLVRRTSGARCGLEYCVAVQLLAKLAAEGLCIDLISTGFVLVVA